MKGTLKKLTAVILSLVLLGSAGVFTGLNAFADIPEGGYTIAPGQTLDVEVVGTGSDYESLTWVKFVPQTSGIYTFYSSSDNDTYGYLYAADREYYLIHNDDGGEGYNFNLDFYFAAGQTYWFGVRYCNYSKNGHFPVTLSAHGHADANKDGKCDSCGAECFYTVTEDSPAEIENSAQTCAAATFTCAGTGYYSFDVQSSDYSVNYYIYDSEGNQLSKVDTLNEGETYTVALYNESYNSKSATVSVSHIHADGDGDGLCDLDSEPADYSVLTAGSPLTVNITDNGSSSTLFKAEATGWYEFDAAPADSVYCYPYDNNYGYSLSGESTIDGRYFYQLEKGRVYTIILSNSSGSAVAATLTASYHNDADCDGVCDNTACGGAHWAVFSEGTPQTISIPSYDKVTAFFTPSKDGWYDFTIDPAGDIYAYVYRLNGNGVNAETTIDGRCFYQLEKGQIYMVNLYNEGGGAASAAVTAVYHCDSNEDGVCDNTACGGSHWAYLSLGTPLTLSIPRYTNVYAYFIPSEDGWYEFDAGSVNPSVYTATEMYICDYKSPDGLTLYRLEKGEKYKVYLYNGSGNDTDVTVTATVHNDDNNDGVCDVEGCGGTHWIALADGVSRTINVSANSTVTAFFIPSKDGWYNLDIRYNSGSPYTSLYDEYDNSPDQDYIDNVGDVYNLKKGEIYYLYVSTSSSSDVSVTATLSYVHVHTDKNDDGVCDDPECGKVIWVALKENVPATITMDDEFDGLAGVFIPDKDGWYEFATEYSSVFGTNAYCYPANYDGNGYPEYEEYGSRCVYNLQKGQKYKVYLYKYGGMSSEKLDVTLTVKPAHAHVDANEDGICDVPGCGYKLWVTLTEGVPADVTVAGYGYVAYFTPEADGWYVIDARNKTNNKMATGYFYNEDGEGYPPYEYNASRYISYLEAGTKYSVYLSISNYGPEDYTVTITAVSTHPHVDENEDGVCDVEGCGYLFWVILTEDEPFTLTLMPGDNFTAYFTPDRNGLFVFDSSNNELGMNVYIGSYGSTPSYYYDEYGYNGNKAVYTLEQGVQYRLYLYNYDSSPFAANIPPVTSTITATHAHYTEGDETMIVEPTVAAYGASSIVCDKCGETCYGLAEPDHNSYHSGTTEDGFSYAIYSDGNGNMEAAITGYTGEETEVVFPSEIDGIPVTAIGDTGYSMAGSVGLFYANPEITSVVIPDSVQSINPNAFTMLTGLKQVTIPNSVEVIGDNAFADCVNLDTVIMGNGVKYIGENAFCFIPDEAEKAYLKEEAAYSEAYYESMLEYYDEEKEYILEGEADAFSWISDELGTEITSWQEIYDYIDSLTDEEIEAKFGPGATRESEKDYYKEGEAYYAGQLANLEAQKQFYETLPGIANTVVAAEENPLGRVMYAGSEDDWNAIITKDGNGQLAEAPRSYNGEGLYFAIFMADGKEVAKVTFAQGQKSVAEPAVPAKTGYTGKWEAYTLNNADITINAVYTANAPATYTATFTVDGKVVKKANVAAGAKIPTPPAPTKSGYTFKGWNPKVPAKMPAKNMTFKAVFEKKADAKVTFEKSASVAYRTKVTITATGENLPKGTVLAIYEKGGSKPLAKGNAKSVSYEAGEMKSAKTYEVRVIDSKGNAQKGLGGEIKIDVTGTGFFQRIIAFFKYLFSPVPTKTVGPKVK